MVPKHSAKIECSIFCTSVYYKINLTLLFGSFAVMTFHDFYYTHINGTLTAQKLIIDNVLHYVRFFLLPEIQSCVTKSDVGTIIL